jgi:hypothetical protein
MFKASAELVLATTLTGSIPRPAWYTENLAGRSFSAAMGTLTYREQYTDRVRDVLAKGVPLDLHPRSFRTGDVASTLVAYIGVQIQQLDERPTARYCSNHGIRRLCDQPPSTPPADLRRRNYFDCMRRYPLRRGEL